MDFYATIQQNLFIPIKILVHSVIGVILVDFACLWNVNVKHFKVKEPPNVW